MIELPYKHIAPPRTGRRAFSFVSRVWYAFDTMISSATLRELIDTIQTRAKERRAATPEMSVSKPAQKPEPDMDELLAIFDNVFDGESYKKWQEKKAAESERKKQAEEAAKQRARGIYEQLKARAQRYEPKSLDEDESRMLEKTEGGNPFEKVHEQTQSFYKTIQEKTEAKKKEFYKNVNWDSGGSSEYNDGKYYANTDSLQGIGILENGEVVYGNNLNPINVRMLKLKVACALGEITPEKAESEMHTIERMYNKTGELIVMSDEPIESYLIHDISDGFRESIEHNEIYASSPYVMPDPVQRMMFFYNLVRSGGPMDMKNNVYADSPVYILDGEIVDRDVMANINYGYLGKVMEFPDELLYYAAGYAQKRAGTSKNEWNDEYYGDDPRDQERIRQGIELYNRSHSS